LILLFFLHMERTCLGKTVMILIKIGLNKIVPFYDVMLQLTPCLYNLMSLNFL
jgi:hypothetical protein